MTERKLTLERNIFIVVFILAFVLSAIFNQLRMNNIYTIDENFHPLEFQEYIIILSFLKIVLIYIVYRFSRVLQISKKLTLLYCILAPLSLVQIIPAIFLLAKVKSARLTINTP